MTMSLNVHPSDTLNVSLPHSSKDFIPSCDENPYANNHTHHYSHEYAPNPCVLTRSRNFRISSKQYDPASRLS